MPLLGIRGRLERLRSKLGFNAAPDHAIVRIGLAGPAVEWFDAGLIGCSLPELTPELAEALLGLQAMGAELGQDSGMDPGEEADLRRLILAVAVDDCQRHILAGIRDWSVVFEIFEMEEWVARPYPRDDGPDPPEGPGLDAAGGETA